MEIVRQKLAVVEDMLNHYDHLGRLALQERLRYEFLTLRPALDKNTKDQISSARLEYEAGCLQQTEMATAIRNITGATSIEQLREDTVALKNLYSGYVNLTEQIVTSEATLPVLIQMLEGDEDSTVQQEREKLEVDLAEIPAKRRHRDLIAAKINEVAERIQYKPISRLERI